MAGIDGLRIKRATELFRTATRLPVSERSAWLDEECEGDKDLRHEIESLLTDRDTKATVVGGPITEQPAPGAPTVKSSVDRGKRDERKIGRYRVIHEIGRGGMGVVYLAMREDDGFKRRVALKLLKRGMDTDDVLRRFELERQLLASLNHPGIARLFDGGETEDGLPYFAMEYVEGLDIQTYCDQHRLDIDERLVLFRKVCEAVHHAHQNLIVHRDLKPSNIIVTEDGQPKLLDFGIAKLINPEFALIAGDPTAPEIRVMTPEYASPEQVMGNPITTASDVYSLGVLLYELVSGHAPYRLGSRVRAELERVICQEEPERPSTAVTKVGEEGGGTAGGGTAGGGTAGGATTGGTSITTDHVNRTRTKGGRPERLRRRLSGDIDNIVLMAMRKEPQRRYASAEQLAEDLERHAGGLPVIARPDTMSYRAAKFVRRHRLGVGAAAMITVALVGGVTVAAAGWNAAEAGWSAADLREAQTAQARDDEAAQRAIAEAERDRADRRFREVRALAHTFMFDFHDAIQELDGSVPARELLVTTALAYLDGLRQEVGDDIELQRELATAYERVGDIRGGIRNPSLGDIDGAMANYGQALEIRTALAGAAEDDPDLARELSTIRIRIGDVLMQQGDVNGAREVYEQALATRQARADANPDDAGAKRDLAVALGNVAAARLAQGDSAGALELYDRSLTARRELAAGSPDDASVQRDLSVAYLRVGGRMANAGRHAEALDNYETAVEIRERVFAMDRTSSRHRRDLAVAHYFVGAELMALGDPAAALNHLNEYLWVTTDRVEASPLNARARRDLGLAHDIVGQAHRKLGDTDKAIEHFQEFGRIMTGLSEDDPGNVRYRAWLASSHEQMGRALAVAGDHAGASDEAQAALEIYEGMADAVAEDVRLQEAVARLHLSLGGWNSLAGRRGETLKQLESARERFAALLEINPEDASVRIGLADTLHELAKLMIEIGDPEAALANAREAADLAAEPSPALLADLAAAHALSGDDARAAEIAAEAIAALDAAADDESEDDAALRTRLAEDLARYRGGS